MSETLPCPFCGDVPDIDGNEGSGYYIECICEATAQTFTEPTEAEAAARWNTRTAAPGMAWVRVEDELPPAGVPVLVTNGRQTKIDMLLAGTNRRREKGPSVYEGEHIERVIETPAQSWENGATKDPNGMPAPLDYYSHWAPLPPAPETGEGESV